MSNVLEYSMPFLRDGGRMLAMKGPRAEEEMMQAEQALDLLGAGDIEVVEAWPEEYGNELVIACLIK